MSADNEMNPWLNGVGWMWAKIAGVLWGIGKVVAAIGGLVATLAGTVWAFVDLNGGLDGIAQSINQAAALIQPLPIAPVLHAVNRVFPLNELVIMEFSLLSVTVACVVIRWVVSWIPLPTHG